MVTYYLMPRIKITATHSGADYQLEGYHTVTDVILVENGISQTIIRALDRQGETFLNKVDTFDNIKVEIQHKDAPSPSWKQVYGGWTFDLTPTLDQDESEIVTVTSRGYGLGLLAMSVGEEYGTESPNSSLNTIKEVLTDATYGIIPKWVHKVLNTATDSGYTYDVTKVADLTSDFRYLYYPFKPALKCLEDMIDLISAANAPNAGCHWIVIPDGTTAYLCLATVGNHENPPADIWPTWWNTDRDGSTIVVKEDMIVSSFTKQRSDANYILYKGKVVKPLDLDDWTENNSGEWTGSGTYAAIFNDGDSVVGDYSIGVRSWGTAGQWRLCMGHYPSARNLALNISGMGGKYDVPIVHFWWACDTDVYNNARMVKVHFLEALAPPTTKYFSEGATADNIWSGANEFVEATLPIGPYYQKAMIGVPKWFTSWGNTGSASWSNINALGVYIMTNVDNEDVSIDNLYISGSVLRGARDDTKIGTQKARVKVYVDDVAKDDTIRSGTPGTTDLGAVAQLAKAELYRSITTPTVGKIVILGQENILPGQLCHIHFGLKSDGAFNIDKDMRILRVLHRFAPKPHGFRTYLTLTDDVKNSRALEPNVGYNLLMKAVNPDYRTRERSSLKARELDISQTILSENYST